MLDLIFRKMGRPLAITSITMYNMHAQIKEFVGPFGQYLRRLRRAMEKLMSIESIREEQELIPGGDIRIKGNHWLRKAWSKSKATRVPREPEFRKLVSELNQRHKLCILVYRIFSDQIYH